MSERNVERWSVAADKIKDKLEKVLDEPGGLSVEQLASSWRAIAEVERAESEVARSREVGRFEKLKFWVPITASLISTMALIARERNAYVTGSVWSDISPVLPEEADRFTFAVL